MGFLARPGGGSWGSAILNAAGLMAIVAAHPVERLLGWRYDPSTLTSPLASWPDTLAWLLIAIVGETVWSRCTRRGRAARARRRADLLAGRVLRMPFAARVGVLLGSMVLVLGVVALRRSGHAVEPGMVAIAWVVFLTAVLHETACLMLPGASVLPDPRDELMAFFRGRVLMAGFAAAIASLALVSLLAVFLPAAMVAALPVCLAASVLIPAWLLRRLEREADAAD